MEHGIMAESDQQVMFSEQFDDELDAGWFWLRENPGCWRLREGGLEIMVEPGLAATVRNALVRPAPDRSCGPYAIEVTIFNHKAPRQQFEQAGITWYQNGEPVFKEVKELVDGNICIVPGLKPMSRQSVRLRLVVNADSWEAQFRPEGASEYETAAGGELPAADEEQVSIQCYNGPTDAEHWIRFEDFRIVRL